MSTSTELDFSVLEELDFPIPCNRPPCQSQAVIKVTWGNCQCVKSKVCVYCFEHFMEYVRAGEKRNSPRPVSHCPECKFSPVIALHYSSL